MKIICLAILVLFLSAGVSHAACIEPDIATYTACTEGCPDAVTHTESYAKCVNGCISTWNKAEDEYYACTKAEREQAEQKKREEEQRKAAMTFIVPVMKDPSYTGVKPGNTVESSHGLTKIFRGVDELVPSVGFTTAPGDIMTTENGASVELKSDYGTVVVDEDTDWGEIIITDDDVITPDVPEGILDPDYKLPPDDIDFYLRASRTLVEFFYQEFDGEHRPSFNSCKINSPTTCIWGVIKYIYEGKVHLYENTPARYPRNPVLTPRAAITPDGTEYLVEVTKDGATSVTVLNGSVFVTDVASFNTTRVYANQKIVLPNDPDGLTRQELEASTTAIDPASVDRWWEKSEEMPIEETSEEEVPDEGIQKSESKQNTQFIIFFIIIMGVAIAVGSVIRARLKKSKGK
ncbi:MAG: hypothetical protein KKD17_00800 [Nanoarchaeota archaeon]|nr:hypothetical protein [Nanoarchaeota archaeon]